jgi:hypothetical protein
MEIERHHPGDDDDVELVEQVRLTVPTTDDPTLPVWTFRMWTIGVVSCALRPEGRRRYVSNSDTWAGTYLIRGHLADTAQPNNKRHIPDPCLSPPYRTPASRRNTHARTRPPRLLPASRRPPATSLHRCSPPQPRFRRRPPWYVPAHLISSSLSPLSIFPSLRMSSELTPSSVRHHVVPVRETSARC